MTLTNTSYDAPLQGSGRSYDTGIGTTDVCQAEFDSGEWQTVSGGFRMYLHSMSLIYSEMMRVIRNDDARNSK